MLKIIFKFYECDSGIWWFLSLVRCHLNGSGEDQIREQVDRQKHKSAQHGMRLQHQGGGEQGPGGYGHGEHESGDLLRLRGKDGAIHKYHKEITVENVAKKYSLVQEKMDEFVNSPGLEQKLTRQVPVCVSLPHEVTGSTWPPAVTTGWGRARSCWPGSWRTRARRPPVSQ